MATVSEIVADALRRIHVVPLGSDPTADEADDALTHLNDMIQSWTAEDVHTGIDLLVLADRVPLDDKHIGGLKDLLAVRLAPDYGATAPAHISDRAMKAWQLLCADFKPMESLRIDSGLLSMPSQRRY
jgi:hypothetical protein